MARLAFALRPWRVPGLSAARRAALAEIVPAELMADCEAIAAEIAFRVRLARVIDTPRNVRSLLRGAARLVRAYAGGAPGALERLRALADTSPHLAAAIAYADRTAHADAGPEQFARAMLKLKLTPAIVQQGDPAIYRLRRGRRNACPADLLMPLADKLRRAGMRPADIETALALIAGVDTELVATWRRRHK